MEENLTLAEANRRYRMHTTELKDRVESIVEDKKIIEAQQEQIEFLQEKLEQIQAVHSMTARERHDSTGGLGEATTADTADGSHAEEPVIPPAPPPPPIDGVPTFGTSLHTCIVACVQCISMHV